MNFNGFIWLICIHLALAFGAGMLLMWCAILPEALLALLLGVVAVLGVLQLDLVTWFEHQGAAHTR